MKVHHSLSSAETRYRPDQVGSFEVWVHRAAWMRLYVVSCLVNGKHYDQVLVSEYSLGTVATNYLSDIQVGEGLATIRRAVTDDLPKGAV